MIRVVLCDDEPLALERLKGMIERYRDIEVVGTATDGRSTLQIVAETRPDAVFIDIEMPGLDGFDVVEEMTRWENGPTPFIIFVTAYPRFALHAFDTGAMDFLTKPVRIARLDASLERLRAAHQGLEAKTRLEELSVQLDVLRLERSGASTKDDHLWVQRRNEVLRVDHAMIDWIQAEGEYVRLHCGGTSYLHRAAIGAMEDLLDDGEFVRIHRSYQVNRRRVISLRRQLHGALKLTMATGEELPVGRSYRKVARTIILLASQQCEI